MLIYSEGFDYYVKTTFPDTGNRVLGLSGWYQFEGLVGISEFAPYEFGKSLSFAAADGAVSTFSGVAFTLPGDQIEAGFFGCSFYIGDNVEEGPYNPTIAFHDVTTPDDPSFGIVPQFTVGFGPFGTIKIWTGPEDTDLLFTSAPGKWTTNTWSFIEIGFVIGTTTGEIEVRINTVPVCSFVNIDNQYSSNPEVGAIRFGSRASATSRDGAKEVWWDNIYVCDTAGDAPNNTFLGLTRCQGLLLAGDGDSTEWVPFDAMLGNWENASNTEINDDLYVSSADAGDFDLYEINPLVNTPIVFGVSVKGAYRQTDATQRSVKNLIKSGTTTGEGEEHFTSESYQMYKDIFETNPDTGVAWTGAEVNAAQIGPKLES